MAKQITIHKSHHVVQLVQRDGFICVICKKCSCCHADRMTQECRTPEFLQSVAPLVGLLPTGSDPIQRLP